MNSGVPRILLVSVALMTGYVCWAETAPTVLELQAGLARVENVFDTQLNGWRTYGGDPAGAEKPDSDDSAWDIVDVGHGWPAESICWLRRWIEVPQKVAGLPVEGSEVTIQFKMDNPACVYVNGALTQEIDWYGKGSVVLTEAARPGERFLVAVRAEGGGHIGFRPWPGTLENAQLETPGAIEVLPRIETLLEKMRFAIGLVETGASQREWRRALGQTLEALERAGRYRTGPWLGVHLEKRCRACCSRRRHGCGRDGRDREGQEAVVRNRPVELVELAEKGLDVDCRRRRCAVGKGLATYAGNPLPCPPVALREAMAE